MGLIERLGKRFRAEFISRIVTVIAGGALLVILARLLDPDNYGLLFLAISILEVTKYISRLGIGSSAARYIAEYKETNPGQLPHILRFSFLLNIISIIVVCFILFSTHEKIAILIGESDLIPLLLIGILFVAFATILRYVRKTLQGFESIEASAVLYSTNSIIRFLLAVGLVMLGYGAIGALIGYIVAFAVTSLVGLMYLYIHHYRNTESECREPNLRRRIAEYTIPLTATDTATVIDNRFDILLVGYFLGPLAVAYYTIGKQIVTFLEAPMSALGFTLSPSFEVQKEKGNVEKAARLYEQALTHSLLLYIPAAAGLILVAEPMLEIVFGETYTGAAPVLQVLAIYAVLQAVTKLTSDSLNFLGRARSRAIAKGITAFANVIMNILLIPLIGVVGAAVATVISYSFYTLANVYIMQLEFDIRIDWLLHQFMIIIIITVAMSVPVYLTVSYISGFVSLFLVVIIGIVMWLVLVIGSGMVDLRRAVSILK
ncbi:flippase [Natrialbaceae archaeon AArc-T1-2]|uniref:flippase n=1 Tax=Natrialbaceae archaeon AArc-T1-2 TaxID=3053904 RepID=UPI00255A80C3|nr:flippase [Natrialbaceae archaeon AArc-T1-2]WIV68829.1 flippase [Natrialbaceae archaeon AArc-T1-2]